MAALTQGEASSAINPKLDIFMRVSATLVDVFILEFQIFEKIANPAVPTQVYPPSGRSVVNVTDPWAVGDRIGIGHYAARYTVPAAAPTGTYEIRWFFRLTSSTPEQEFREEFEVLPAGAAATAGYYCTIADLREEGVPSTGPNAITDARLDKLISRSSRFVDRATRRWFEARRMTITLDGSGAVAQILDMPIIAVEQLLVDEQEVPLDYIKVYNRHLSERLLDPDDRENPRIELIQPFDALFFRYQLDAFPPGQRNVQVVGTFGYTDYDGTPTGATPDEICHVTKLLVMRGLTPMYQLDATGVAALTGGQITQVRTRDQAIEYADPFSGGQGGVVRGQGLFTGDPRIDNILAMFSAPPLLRAV